MRAPSASPAGRRAVALVVFLALVTVAGCGGPESGGPLDVVNVDSVGYPFYAGVTGAIGVTVVENLGDRDAVVTAVRPLEVTPGLVVERTLVGGQNRELASWCCIRRFSSSALTSQGVPDPRPVAGAIVAPSRSIAQELPAGLNLIFLLRAERPGDYEFRAVEVSYRVGDRRYRRVLRSAFRGCFRQSLRVKPICKAPQALTAGEAAKL